MPTQSTHDNPLSTEAHVDVHRQRRASEQAGFFLQYLEPGMSVLDCGCGPGAITVGIAQHVAPGHVIGVDLSAERVTEARELARIAGAGNVTFEVGDIRALRFDEATFDAAFEHCVFMHLADPLSVAREVLRVLKPGGLFGARDHDHDYDVGLHPEEVSPTRLIVDRWRASLGSNMRFGKQLPKVLMSAGFEPVAGSASFENFATPERVAELTDAWTRDLRRTEFIEWAVAEGLLTELTQGEDLAQRRLEWSREPGTFWSMCGVEFIGRKSAS